MNKVPVTELPLRFSAKAEVDLTIMIHPSEVGSLDLERLKSLLAEDLINELEPNLEDLLILQVAADNLHEEADEKSAGCTAKASS